MRRSYVAATIAAAAVVIVAGALGLAYGGGADKLLRLEQWRTTTYSGTWPAEGSIKAYA